MRRLPVVALALALVVVPAATAGNPTFAYSVTTGSPVTAPGITLSGDDQTTTFTVVSQVTYTGSKATAGWNIAASATTLTSGSNTLPALQVTNGSFACSSGCVINPSNLITFPITLSGTAAKIYDANTNTGQGIFDVTSTFQVSYPANALPGTYSATLTLTGSTGP